MFTTAKGHTKEQLEAREAANPGRRATMLEKRRARSRQLEREKVLALEGEPMGTREELLALAYRGDKYAIWRCNNLFGHSWKREK